jgi:hypothetical protein
MSTHLTPVEVCEALIGPLPRLAVVAGLHPKSPFVWRRHSEWRQAGDMPPRVNRLLLDHSDAHDLGLTAEHLIRGADSAEIAAILAARPQSQQAAA